MSLALRNVILQAFQETSSVSHSVKTYETDEVFRNLNTLSRFLVGGAFKYFDRLADELIKAADQLENHVLRRTISALFVLRYVYSGELETAQKLQESLENEGGTTDSAVSLVSRLSLDLYRLIFFEDSRSAEQLIGLVSSLQRLICNGGSVIDGTPTRTLRFLTSAGLKVDNESLEVLKVLLNSNSRNELIKVWKNFISDDAAWRSFFLKEIINLGFIKLSEAELTQLHELILDRLGKFETIYNMVSLKVPLLYVEKALATYFGKTQENTLRVEKEKTFDILRNSMSCAPEQWMAYVLWRVGLLPTDSTLGEVVDFLAALIPDSFDEVEGLRLVVRDAKTDTNIEVTFGEIADQATASEQFLLNPELLHVSEDFDENSSMTFIISLGRKFIEKPHEHRQAIFSKALDFECVIRSVLKSAIAYERTKYDHLTALYSRTYMTELIERLFREFSRNEGTFSVFVLDIDFFKNVNDKYGHQFGDTVLRTIAGVLKSEGRLLAVGRFGGEEFLGVASVNKEACARICWDLKERIKQRTTESCGLPISASVGIAESSEAASVTGLIGLADQRLYRAKAEGRDRVVSR